MRFYRALSIAFCGIAPSHAEQVAFDWFEYTGRDTVFEQPLPPGSYRNPVLAGFYPDPSITRAGDRFYLVNSTFVYFPGIPVFESTDLVHWSHIGNVIERPSQLDFDGLGTSRGVFAPTIEFHDGTFYVLNTAVDSGGNFFVTASDPAGPWSDPHWLPGIDGIDPSFFFDDDGRVYILNNGPPDREPLYDGHRAIWIQEFDLAARQLVGERKVLVDGGVDISTKPIWIEGPHIYSVDGWYYLVCAEGGTGPNHSQVVLRSRSVWGPYDPYEGNPILTQRDLPPDRPKPVTNAGHADLVQAPDGSWWATFLATRTYEDIHYNTGRETFLLPVTWRDGWPVILERGQVIPYIAAGPGFLENNPAAPPTTGNFTWRDDFDSSEPDPAWLQLRVPKVAWFDRQRREGWLSVKPSAESLDTLGNPAFLARRQQHFRFEASTALHTPLPSGVAAGMAAFQSEKYWYFLGARQTAKGLQLFLEKSTAGNVQTIAVAAVTKDPASSLRMKIAGDERSYSFYYDADGKGWTALRVDDDGRILSTEVAGGFVGAVVGVHARIEDGGAAPYLDPDRSFDERAADLVSRMTLEEKVSQTLNNAPAIPRLDIPAYEWWNEALHGVARAGAATVFPQAIGLAATFDPVLMHEIATVISDEARAKHHEFASRGLRGRYQGLTFWSPNINIFRDPRWGRGQETYGEDPFLTSIMGVAFVKGLQGDDPVYRKVDATAKHFAVHSGPEADRHHFDVHPDERDLYETYLPAFEALVKEGPVAAVMGAYNRVYGESASASELLLEDILRTRWQFEGYVVSDCDSIEDIWKHHKIVATPEEAAALGVRTGGDLNCGSTYGALVPAVEQGLVTEADIDVVLERLMRTRFRLGMFDPPERVRWARIPYSVNQAPEHDSLARRAAQASMVLLKNDGVLPLSRDMGRIAVIGPTADEVMSLLGNYYGTPEAPVTVLQGIRRAVGPDTAVLYSRGADLVEGREEPRAAPAIESSYLRPAANSPERGLRGEYFRGREFEGEPVMTRIDPQVSFRWDRGAPTDALVARGELPVGRALAGDNFSIRWTGQLLPPVSGRYELHIGANDGFRLYLDDDLVAERWDVTSRTRNTSVPIELEADRPYDLRLEYFEDGYDAEVRLAWRLPGAKPPFEEALEAAQNAEVVVFVGGLTGDIEGEEMDVNYPGFAGGDRTDLRLPASQRRLLEALADTGKPVVLVLTAGGAMAVDWAEENLPAILMAWYPGQRGGDAVADVLFGDANPAGRLPVTFYREGEALPPFEDYSMEERTYRYFSGSPLYPFGHGLTYTRFEYADLELDRTEAASGDPVQISLSVKNAGSRAGEEVVQLYLQPVEPARARAVKELRGVERLALQPGETQTVSFRIVPARDLRHYDVERKAYAVDPGDYEVQAGASSTDVRLRGRLTVTADTP